MTGSRWLLLTAIPSLHSAANPKSSGPPSINSAAACNRGGEPGSIEFYDHQQNKDTSSIDRGSAVLN